MLNFNVGDYFKRIIGNQNKEVLFRMAVQSSIKSNTSIDVPIGSITSKGGIINVKGLSAGAKSAIFIKKEAIVATVNREQQVYIVKDITSS